MCIYLGKLLVEEPHATLVCTIWLYSQILFLKCMLKLRCNKGKVGFIQNSDILLELNS